MAKRKKSIRLRPDEDSLLRQVYLSEGIPSDQYAKRPPGDLARFIRRWNTLSERTDSSEEVQHYIKTKRKNKQWVTFEGNHKRSEAIPEDILASDQWATLNTIYEETCIARGLGSDNIDYDEGLAKEFSQSFARLTGLIFPGRYLLAILMHKRKRGDLPTIGDKEDSRDRRSDIGFGDIDDIAI